MIDKVNGDSLIADTMKYIREEMNNVTYKEARVYLDEVSKYGSVLGLDAIRGLLYELGDPQKGLKFIHIAGTNGKGSVLAYTSTILSESGLKTGRYVSPTVTSYLERIQIDGQWISEEMFAELVEEVQRAVARMEADGKASPTVFEIETAIAFLYFRKMNCDVVVLETGLGGSLDATNVVENTVLAVFSSISRDHMGFLGNTLEEIAKNKAGIIKSGCTVVSAPQRPEVKAVLEREATRLGCSVIYAEPERAQVLEEGCFGQMFSYKDMPDIRISLAGRHQIVNALTAWEAVHAWDDRIPTQAVRDGFARTRWIGRFTCISKNPLFFVDGAHNEDAARRLRESVDTYFGGKKLTYIMGVFKDKEYEKIVEWMLPCAAKIYTVNLPDENRTLDAAELKKIIECAAERLSVPVEVHAAGSVETAVEQAVIKAKPEEVILAFGSLSYLGSVMETVARLETHTDVIYDQ